MEQADSSRVGRLERVALREVWPHEAWDFTPWLQENVGVLNDVLNLDLDNVEREQDAGNFSVDLVAEEDGGRTVVIENQLEKSDHDHLGKLLTYLSTFDAEIAIWMVADPRPEHVNAITWLNESSAASFFLVKVEAVRIGDSAPAPLLTLIVGPSEEIRQVGATKKDLNERQRLRRQFWEELLERARERTDLHAGVAPRRGSWCGTGAGKAGMKYVYRVRQGDTLVAFYLDREDGAENRAFFHRLQQSRREIEEAFGAPLQWVQKEGRKRCSIEKELTLGGLQNEEEWPEIQEQMIETMIRLEKALRPHVKAL